MNKQEFLNTYPEIPAERVQESSTGIGVWIDPPRRTTFIVAILPADTIDVLTLSYELPPEPLNEQTVSEFRAFIALSVKCGARGFYRDVRDFPVESSMGPS